MQEGLTHQYREVLDEHTGDHYSRLELCSTKSDHHTLSVDRWLHLKHGVQIAGSGRMISTQLHMVRTPQRKLAQPALAIRIISAAIQTFTFRLLEI